MSLVHAGSLYRKEHHGFFSDHKGKNTGVAGSGDHYCGLERCGNRIYQSS